MAFKPRSCSALFGPFRVDLETGEILKSGVRIRLQHQPFRVLSILLERPGGLVTRDELRERLWTEDTFVDFEHGVTTAVKKLRQTLNDSAAKPRYVETLPKRGYRFIAEVEFEEHAAPEPVPTTALTPAETSSSPAASAQAAVAAAPAPEPPAAAPSSSPDLDGLPARPRFFERRTVRAAAVALAALTVASLFAFSRPESRVRDAGAVRRLAFVPKSLSQFAPGASVSPDGRYVAFVGAGPDFQLWVQDLAEEEPTPVDGSQSASLPFWSPDSSQIGFVSGGRLLRVSPHGGAPIEVSEMPAGNYAGGSWSPSGERIVFSAGRPPRMFSVAAAGGAPEPLFDPVSIDERSGDGNRDPAFLHNDDRPNLLAFAVGRPSRRSLFVRDLDSGEQQMLDRGERPVYASSGHLLYERAGDVWAVRFSTAELALTGESRLVADGGLGPSVSAAGTLVYSKDPTADSERRLAWRDRMGNRLGAIGAPREGPSYFALSPDGSKAAVISYGDRPVPVALLDLRTGVERALDLGDGNAAYVIWSPDSRSLAWREGRGPRTALWVDAVPGERSFSSGVRIPTPQLRDVSDWVADGSTLFYSRSDNLWSGRLTSGGQWQGEELLARRGQQVSARLSPDGGRLAYSSDESGQFEVYLAPREAPDQAIQVSQDGGVQPAWSPDGRELYFISRGRMVALPVAPRHDPNPAEAQVLFSDRALFSPNKARYVYAVGPDGRFLMLEHVEGSEPLSIRVVDNWVEAHWPSAP